MIVSEFKKRRELLMAQVGKDNIAIIASANIQIRNRDVAYPFRQDSDFYYLTGFNEENALAVFIPERKQGQYILFCQELDTKKALWEGTHAGLEGAVQEYGADDAFPISDLDDILPSMLENKHKVFYLMGLNYDLDHHIMEWITHIRSQTRSGIFAPGDLVSLQYILHEMRLIKSPAEIKLMQTAINVSAKAHIRAMQYCQAGRYEYQIEAEILHELMHNGLQETAYPSIVAGGRNACVLHYTKNKAVLKEGDLLLIDAGAECDYYAADITRTIPVNGVFTQAQKLLYQLVLDAQLAAIEEIKVDAPWNKAHEVSVQILTEGLVELGLLTGCVDSLIADEAYKIFYMHRIGHWLGMDVHDVGNYKINNEWRVLEPGMVLSVEPGLYIPEDCSSVDEKWRGIGIRIEDDVLVTQQGYQVLSHAIPKKIADIEAIMQQGNGSN